MGRKGLAPAAYLCLTRFFLISRGHGRPGVDRPGGGSIRSAVRTGLGSDRKAVIHPSHMGVLGRCGLEGGARGLVSIGRAGQYSHLFDRVRVTAK